MESVATQTTVASQPHAHARLHRLRIRARALSGHDALGMKSELTREQRQLFLENGAMHLFAISGLHIGVIAACGHTLFLLVRFPKKLDTDS